MAKTNLYGHHGGRRTGRRGRASRLPFPLVLPRVSRRRRFVVVAAAVDAARVDVVWDEDVAEHVVSRGGDVRVTLLVQQLQAPDEQLPSAALVLFPSVPGQDVSSHLNKVGPFCISKIFFSIVGSGGGGGTSGIPSVQAGFES